MKTAKLTLWKIAKSLNGQKTSTGWSNELLLKLPKMKKIQVNEIMSESKKLKSFDPPKTDHPDFPMPK